MLTIENLQSVFEEVLEAVDGKISDSRYLSYYNNVEEMLKDLDLTAEYVNEHTEIGFDVTALKTPFIVSDYALTSFYFLASADGRKVKEYIENLTAK